MQQHEENLCAKLKESAPGYSEGQHNKTNFAATDWQTITRRDRPYIMMVLNHSRVVHSRSEIHQDNQIL